MWANARRKREEQSRGRGEGSRRRASESPCAPDSNRSLAAILSAPHTTTTRTGQLHAPRRSGPRERCSPSLLPARPPACLPACLPPPSPPSAGCRLQAANPSARTHPRIPNGGEQRRLAYLSPYFLRTADGRNPYADGWGGVDRADRWMDGWIDRRDAGWPSMPGCRIWTVATSTYLLLLALLCSAC